MHSPYEVVRMFEENLCEYTGAPRCVATTSCTMALLMCLRWYERHGQATHPTIAIPKRTYIGVGMSAVNAGMRIKFTDEDWYGSYLIPPYNLYDSARFLSGGMYLPGSMMCLSFHWTKHLAIGMGGAILLPDDPDRHEWLLRMRFDGRSQTIAPDQDMTGVVGQHAYMTPALAAEGMSRLAVLPAVNQPLPNSNYPDLSKIPAFQRHIA